jgi:Domain of unknown function (DUF4276)
LNRVLLLVEGQTEERFVKDVLQPHLWPFGVSLEPKTVTTKLVVGAPSHKGGGDFTKMLGDVHRLLKDSNAVAVTTLFDFYGFSTNVPGAAAAAYADVDALESAIAAVVGDDRFRPYLQKHEFEAFLFVDSIATARAIPDVGRAPAIEKQAKGFACVEDINNHPDTAPSKRLATALGSFSKVRLGPIVTARLGIAKLRAAAPRFSSWVAWLESLGVHPS